MCTDTIVGLAVYYYNNGPVAISTQTARKSDEILKFIDLNKAKIIKDLIQSLSISFVPELIENLNYDLEPFYSLAYSSQLMNNKKPE
jgi:hypothetical protein